MAQDSRSRSHRAAASSCSRLADAAMAKGSPIWHLDATLAAHGPFSGEPAHSRNLLVDRDPVDRDLRERVATGLMEGSKESIRVGRAVGRHKLITVQLALALVITGAGILGVDAAASAASSRLCDGYSSCNARPYTTHDYQDHSATSYWEMDAGDECTNYVAYVESTVYGVATPDYLLGDAGSWAADARSHGVDVDQTPTVGSVAVWNGGDAGIDGYGHVAVVEAVGPDDRYIVISQQHIEVDTDGYDWTRINASGPQTQWEQWPDSFIHFGQSGVNTVAFQADDGDLWTVRSAGDKNWRLGMMKGTSPSIAATPGDGYEVAFQADNGDLWTAGPGGERNWHLGLMKGTSPSIAAAAGGGYEVAFQADGGELWTAGPDGDRDLHLGMEPGTNPSIAALSGGGYEVAIQANTRGLWTVGPGGVKDWHLGMKPGTSPSIAAVSGNSYRVAFQSNTRVLWTVGPASFKNWHLGMQVGTNPSIAALSGGGYEVAFQANTRGLWTVGPGGVKDWHLGMRPGSSPIIEATAENGYEVAFQSNTRVLWTVGSAGDKNWKLKMRKETSPSMAV
jgi:surface antigen